MPSGKVEYPVLSPDLQVAFYYILGSLRKECLAEALRAAVSELAVADVDRELGLYVPPAVLQKVASFGLRGEVVFPVPVVLRAKPSLLGYYRLLFGLSQKEFYSKGPFGRFKILEESGSNSERTDQQLEALCRSLIQTAVRLVDGLDDISLPVVHELQLLTLGPQLRGAQNTRIGQDATKAVFALIEDIAGPFIKEATKRTLVIANSAGRTVLVEFASDPDIRITEKLRTGVRPVVSVEIKGGADASNVHNRLGEAEKSHQKARARGFFEFWTILRVDVDEVIARRESPTTSHFFRLEAILQAASVEHRRFSDLLGACLGI
jgi:hypothetical protein